MIRFSAALVAVAIGVLIGGIATSRLLLVYIAIAVSAVALVALAIGVVLKREVLFGEGQGLVPAEAGASPVPPARTGEIRDEVPASANAAPPSPVNAAPPTPVLGAAAGYGVPFGGAAPAASPASASLSAAHPAAAGQRQPADPAAPWEAQAARPSWSSPAPDRMPAGQGQMPAGQGQRAASGAGTRAPSAWQDTSPGKAPAGRAGGWGAPDADAAATAPAATAPRSWAAPPPVPVSSSSQE